MKKMAKKLWVLLLVAAMGSTLLVGCGNNQPQENEQASAEVKEAETTEAETAEAETAEPETQEDDLNGTITISTKARPGTEQGWKAADGT